VDILQQFMGLYTELLIKKLTKYNNERIDNGTRGCLSRSPFDRTGGIYIRKEKTQGGVAGMNADNEGKEIENADKLVKLYKEALDDLGIRYEAKFREFSDLSDKKY
jgi:hypothetical protein